MNWTEAVATTETASQGTLIDKTQANMNLHAHDFTPDDPTNKIETTPDREHPIFAEESLRNAALYYDRTGGVFRRLFGDGGESDSAFGHSTTSPIGVGVLRGYYFTTGDAMTKAHALVTGWLSDA